MKGSIIDRIAAHIGAGERRLPVASEDAVRAAEMALGLGIPALLRSVYLNVANGGFGPGYGVVGDTELSVSLEVIVRVVERLSRPLMR